MKSRNPSPDREKFYFTVMGNSTSTADTQALAL